MNKDRLLLLQEMLKEEPDSSFLLFAIAKEYEKLAEIPLAIQTFLTLKEKDAEYVGLYYHLAKLYEQIEDREKAVLTYQSGIQIAQKVNDLHALAELKNAALNLSIE